ncbi:MAG: serine acetyltransferase [Eubacterium sp.]|nr:serine acetyltransferase [Eubacterium sp.]
MAAVIKTEFDQVVGRITQNYISDEVFVTKENRRLPSRSSIIILIKRLRSLMFPGYFEEKNFEYTDAQYFVGNTLNHIRRELRQQVNIALQYTSEGESREQTAEHSDEIAKHFISRLADIQNMLLKDVQAGFDGDPAAKSRQEIISSYPGVFAIFVYRMAHELYLKNVPFIPRVMTEYAHSRTGIDINPGADIGEYFFIDHGTGVVIGETTKIGNNVKLYQGVTLGALSTRKGQLLAEVKRHPTIENNVTIYSGATILGGETVIGANSIIGGNTFITESVPPYTKVSLKAPEMTFQVDPPKKDEEKWVWDWVI